MNEQIRQLAVQAGIRYPGRADHPVCHMTAATMEKFAMLIVQECIDVVVDVLPDIVSESKDGIHPAWHLKEHFELKNE